MHISIEPPALTEERLCKVIRAAEFALVNGTWSFEEFTAAEFTSVVNPAALAMVRDGERWSQLVPASAFAGEMLAVWMFHFPNGADNSGFVGWLASKIKTRTGSGVAVVCGQNSLRGGIFDYWMCPIEASGDVLRVIDELRSDGIERPK
jgi:Family of unknown function (DUF6196)